MEINKELCEVFDTSENDILAQVSAPCGGCGGRGEKEERVASRKEFHGYKSTPCPTCDGLKVRRITRLQQVMEERGEWNTFVTLVILGEIEYDFYDPDANKLGKAALAWKKGNENGT